MSAPSLLPRIQALEAQARMAGASATSQAPASAAPAASSGLTFLSTPVVVVSNAGSPAIGWTSFTSASIPASATAALLVVTGRRDYTVTGFQFAYVQATSAGPEVAIYGQNSDGVDTDTEGSTGQAFAPVSGQGFQWSKNSGVENFTISVIGYLS